jgi:hypothetical protein
MRPCFNVTSNGNFKVGGQSIKQRLSTQVQVKFMDYLNSNNRFKKIIQFFSFAPTLIDISNSGIFHV